MWLRLDMLDLQVDLTLPTSLLCFICGYHVLAPFYQTTKQRAWILTGLTSGLTSLAALPYFYDFIMSGGCVQSGYLVADLFMGYMFYQQYLTLMTGWIHHILYFGLIQYILFAGWSNIFCLALTMEVPTALLSLGSLHPRWRSDYLFASVFFMTRIVLHVTLIAAYAAIYLRTPNAGDNEDGIGLGLLGATSSPYFLMKETLATNENHTVRLPKSLASPLPATFLLAAFPMHCAWFTGCIRGILRRRAQVTVRDSKVGVPVILLSPLRVRFQALQHRLRFDQDAKERLRARVQAAYGNAQDRLWRRGVWVRRTVDAQVYAQ